MDDKKKVQLSEQVVKKILDQGSKYGQNPTFSQTLEITQNMINICSELYNEAFIDGHEAGHINGYNNRCDEIIKSN